jgi:hypothetical protein
VSLHSVSLTWRGRMEPSSAVQLPAMLRARTAFSTSKMGDCWRTKFLGLVDAALFTELALVRNGTLQSASIWVPYDELVTVLELVRKADLVAVVTHWIADDSKEVHGAVEGLELDPLEFMTYELTLSRDGGVELSREGGDLPHRNADAPPCCVATRERHINSDPLALVWKGDNGFLWPYLALAPLGISPLRHVPCRLDCAESITRVNGFIRSAEELGFDCAAADWSAFPNLELRSSVHSEIGQIMSKEFRFPYRRKDSGRIGASPFYFSRGRASREKPGSTVKEELSAQAGLGFASAMAQRSRWCTVAWEQTAVIKRAHGPIAHLGCGDGLLLELVSQLKAKAALVGTEPNQLLAEAAEARLSVTSNTILKVEWTHGAVILPSNTALTFFDPELLIDLAPLQRRDLLQWLRVSAGIAVAVATDRALHRFGDIESIARICGFSIAPGRRTRMSAVVLGPQCSIAR